MKTLRITIAVFTLLGVVAACGDDGTGTTSGTGVVFGEGEMPPAFPEDFPIPPNAVIGSTLINPVNHRSEMSLQIDAEITAAVQFFNVGLVNQGFVVESSEGSPITWTITFSRGELTGDIVFQTQGDVSQAVVAVNAS